MPLRPAFPPSNAAHAAAPFASGTKPWGACAQSAPHHARGHRRKTGGSAKASSGPGGGSAPTDGEDDSPQFSQDWRTFRAQLVAQESRVSESPSTTSAPTPSGRWVHELSSPEVGCLLVARYENMGMFTKTVILVLAHNDAEGTVGLILNQPTQLTANGTPVQPFWVKGAAGDRTLYLGGPVNTSTVNILHGCKSIDGAKEIVEGVYHGGELTPEVESMPDDDAIHVFMGYAGWGEHQLAAELHDKAWWVLAASKDVILGGPEGVDPSDKDYHSHYWSDVVKLGGLKHAL